MRNIVTGVRTLLLKVGGASYNFKNVHSDGVIHYDVKYIKTSRGVTVPAEKIETHQYLIYNPGDVALRVLDKISGSDCLVDAMVQYEGHERELRNSKLKISKNGTGYKLEIYHTHV